MSVDFESAARLASLKQGIEAETGETYPDLTSGVNALIAGFGQGVGGGLDAILSGTVTEIESGIETIRVSGLRDATSVVALSLPSATKISAYACYGCSNLQSVSIPKALRLEGNVFQNCKALLEIELPSATYLGNTNFSGCSSLQRADFGVSVPNVMTATFQNCTVLSVLVLRNTKLVNLVNTNALSGTPFAVGGTGGTVYVPSALIESYKTATNWSTLYAAGTCNFVALEGSEYE